MSKHLKFKHLFNIFFQNFKNLTLLPNFIDFSCTFVLNLNGKNFNFSTSLLCVLV